MFVPLPSHIALQMASLISAMSTDSWSRWARVSKLKDLSGALWDDQAHAIMLEQEHYLGHYKVAV